MKLEQLVASFEGQFVWLRNRMRRNEDFDSFVERVESSPRFKMRIGVYKHWLTDIEWEHSPFLAMCLFVGIAEELAFPYEAIKKELQVNDQEYDNLSDLYCTYLVKMKADLKRGVRPTSRTAQGKFALKLALIRNFLKVNYNVEI